MKGFTLIELLAVIAILAVILLISYTVVSGVIESSKKKSFELSSISLARSAEIDCREERLTGFVPYKEVVISNGTIISDNEIDIKGSMPDFGFVNVTTKCDVEMAVHNDLWCAVKELDGDVKYSDFTTAATCNVANGRDVTPEEVMALIATGWIPISNVADLNNISDTASNTFAVGTIYEGTYIGGLDKNYIQVGNIEIGMTNPIVGNFTGTYDGNNYNLNNLKINQVGTEGMGLFQSVVNATLKNINLLNVSVVGGNFVGALAAYAEDSDFDKIKVTGNVTGGSNTGGLIGDMYTSESTSGYINNITIDVVVTGVNNVGGVIGSKYSENDSIYNLDNIIGISKVSGEVSVGGIGGYLGKTSISNVVLEVEFTPISGVINSVGGLVGDFDYYPNSDLNNILVTGTIDAIGDVDYVSYIGGLMGGAKLSSGNNIEVNVDVITNGYNVGGAFGILGVQGTLQNIKVTSEVSGTFNVGGLAGQVSNDETIINKAFITGTVNGSDYNVGGFIGLSNATVSNSYTNNSVTGTDNVGGFIGQIELGAISNCYYSGIISGVTEVGGFIGYSDGYNPYSVTNSYWNTTVSLIPTSIAGTGRTDAQLKSATPDATNYIGWSTDIWEFGNASELPILK